MLRAQASRSDGDMLCQAGLKIANASANHEEDMVYKALVQTELIVNIPWTYLNLGTGVLKSHPCFKPGDLIGALARRGKLSELIGTPVESCHCSSITLLCSFLV